MYCSIASLGAKWMKNSAQTEFWRKYWMPTKNEKETERDNKKGRKSTQNKIKDMWKS